MTIATFPKYESYRDSEVPDLGKIPAHWDVIRNRFLFQEQNERSLDGQETHWVHPSLASLTLRTLH